MINHNTNINEATMWGSFSSPASPKIILTQFLQYSVIHAAYFKVLCGLLQIDATNFNSQIKSIYKINRVNYQNCVDGAVPFIYVTRVLFLTRFLVLNGIKVQGGIMNSV